MREVVVVGGGPAGLQAALTLATVHVDVVLLDAGAGRNATAGHVHNLLTRDGVPPEELRRLGRAEVAAYPTATVRHARVRSLAPLPAHGDETGHGAAGSRTAGTGDGERPPGFRVVLEHGEELTARTLVLATGVRDELPDVPGLGALWGDLVVHCPFCHGAQLAGRRVGVLGTGAAAHLTGVMGRVASEIVVLPDGEEGEPPPGASVRPGRVHGVARHGTGLRVDLGPDGTEDLGGLFVTPTTRQAAPFADQLGLERNGSSCVRVDEHGRTSVPGVYAAGDMAHVAALPAPVQTVAQALASGAVAGGSAVADPVDGG